MVSKKTSFLDRRISNRLSYTIIASFAIILLAAFVYAIGSVPNPGHSVAELQKCDNDGEILKMSGGVWTCVTDSSGGTSQWITSGSDIYYSAGKVGIGASGPSHPLVVTGTPWPSGKGLLLSGNDVALWGKSTTGTEHRVIFLGSDNYTYLNAPAGGGLRFRVNEVDKFEISPTGKISGDGSGLTNLIVRIQGAGDTCDATNSGGLRYISGICSADDLKSSYFDMCMRTDANTYSWVNIKTNTWADSVCDTGGCPSGQIWYECTNPDVADGCYASEPQFCYNCDPKKPYCLD